MKITTLLASIMLLAGCGDMYQRDTDGIAHAESGKNEFSKFRVVSVEANGETHDYLVFSNGNQAGIDHLPNCRHCKLSENNKK